MRISMGWRVRSTVSGGGMFFCPLEGADRSYVRTEIRRWVAPFGVPLLPWNRLGDYVRCTDCTQSFTDDVLDIVTTRELAAALERAATGLMSAIAFRAGGGPDVRAAAARELRRFVRDPSAAGVSMPAPDLVDAIEALNEAAANMEATGRRDLFAAAVRVAHAPGDLTGPNFAVLHAAGGSLRIPSRSIRDLIVSEGVLAD